MIFLKTTLLVAAVAIGAFLVVFRIIPYLVYLAILHDWGNKDR